MLEEEEPANLDSIATFVRERVRTPQVTLIMSTVDNVRSQIQSPNTL